jgi:ABC-type phosphate transport system permease subunit
MSRGAFAGLILVGGVIGAVVGGVIGDATSIHKGPNDLVGPGIDILGGAVAGFLIGMVVLPLVVAIANEITSRVKRRRNRAAIASESPPLSPPEP